MFNFKKKSKVTNYFVMPNEAIEKFAARELSTYDVTIFSALCSLRRELKGIRIIKGKAVYCGTGGLSNAVQVAQSMLARMTGIAPKTVREAISRLHAAGLIKGVILTDEPKKKKAYMKSTNIYILKPLPSSGFFFAPRNIFMHSRSTYEGSLKPRDFVMFYFMCYAQSNEYRKSWNSYNDICKRLGYSKDERSKVVASVGKLVALGVINKKARKINGGNVDNIYRVFAIGVINNGNISKRDKRKVAPPRATNQKTFRNKVVILNTFIITRPFQNVNTFFRKSSKLGKNFLLLKGGVRIYPYNNNQKGSVAPEFAKLKGRPPRLRVFKLHENLEVRQTAPIRPQKSEYEVKSCKKEPF